MLTFLKNILSSPASSASARKLESPDDLLVGDIITFQLLPQLALSGKNFQVAAITTYDFKQGRFSSFTLKGEGREALYLTPSANEGEEYLSIRLKINRDRVNSLFGLEGFSAIFDEGAGCELRPLIVPPPLEGWLAEQYHEEVDCRKGYRHAGDYRNRVLPTYEDESEGFDYYLLLDKTENLGIEVEVYDNDETDVYLALYMPFSVIESLWPGSGDAQKTA